jgi:signal transduction histidine kinase
MNSVNNKGNKRYATLIALILAAVASLFFLVVREITPLFLLAYAFALFGIGGFWFGSVYLFGNMEDYPWLAAFPGALLRYLIVEALFSFVFVVLEQLAIFRLPPVWFFVAHALIAACFAVHLVLLKGGKEVIERRDAEVREKTRTLAFLLADVLVILERTPEMVKDIQPVADALRFSDAMSHPSLESYENDIKDSVVQLEQAASEKDTEKVSALCVTLLRQVKDRNNRVKLMK